MYLLTAAERILKHHLRHLPVVDEQGRYLGTFSIYSLLQLTLPKAVLDKHGLDNVAFVTERVEDLAQRLGGRRRPSDRPPHRRRYPVLRVLDDERHHRDVHQHAGSVGLAGVRALLSPRLQPGTADFVAITRTRSTIPLGNITCGSYADNYSGRRALRSGIPSMHRSYQPPIRSEQP